MSFHQSRRVVWMLSTQGVHAAATKCRSTSCRFQFSGSLISMFRLGGDDAHKMGGNFTYEDLSLLAFPSPHLKNGIFLFTQSCHIPSIRIRVLEPHLLRCQHVLPACSLLALSLIQDPLQSRSTSQNGVCSTSKPRRGLRCRSWLGFRLRLWHDPHHIRSQTL